MELLQTFVLIEACRRSRGESKRTGGPWVRRVGFSKDTSTSTAAPLLGQSFLPPLGRRGDSGPGGGLLCNAGEPEIRTYGSSVRFFSPWLLRAWLGTERMRMKVWERKKPLVSACLLLLFWAFCFASSGSTLAALVFCAFLICFGVIVRPWLGMASFH